MTTILSFFYHDLFFARSRAGQEFVSGTRMSSAAGRRFELLRPARALPLTNKELVGEAIAPFLLILQLWTYCSSLTFVRAGTSITS
jgi:hypothetical protein